MASATPFSDISFAIFNDFVQENFSSDISLATVLTVLFTLTNNPMLLTLHVRQQNPKFHGENKTKLSGWIKALAYALDEKLDAQVPILQTDDQEDDKAEISTLAIKLDSLAKLLKLYPYNSKGKFHGKITSVSHTEIQPALIICLNSIECEDLNCKTWVLHQTTRYCNIPKVTLIKGSDIYKNTLVLTGECTKYKTLYAADHKYLSENVTKTKVHFQKIYLNTTIYLKVGQSLWVDRVFQML